MADNCGGMILRGLREMSPSSSTEAISYISRNVVPGMSGRGILKEQGCARRPLTSTAPKILSGSRNLRLTPTKKHCTQHIHTGAYLMHATLHFRKSLRTLGPGRYSGHVRPFEARSVTFVSIKTSQVFFDTPSSQCQASHDLWKPRRCRQALSVDSIV